MTTEPRATLHFDFVDPLSWLMDREIGPAAAEADIPLVYRPFELRPPPAPLVTVDDDALAVRWKLARDVGAGLGIAFDPPTLVPWSRKAHELHLFAAEHDAADPVRAAVFEAYLLEGRDIGRVDVLVAIAVEVGLDRTETKAVLDVDRHDAAVAEASRAARSAGIEDAPTLEVGGARLQGFHNRATLGTFLRGV